MWYGIGYDGFKAMFMDLKYLGVDDGSSKVEGYKEDTWLKKTNVINIGRIFCINHKGPFVYDGVHINELEGSSIAMKRTIF
jgi:hypothetical protein